MSYKVEKIAGPFKLGEGPHWDERQALFFVDALDSSICRYLPKEDRTTVCKVDPSAVVSIVIPMKNKPDKFLVTIGANLTEVTWDGETATPEKVRVLATVTEPGKEGNRFNDGKYDPSGRLWVGTMGEMGANGEFEPEVGSLFSFTKDLTVTKHVDGITIANGLSWSADGKTMYYIDTPTKRVDAFDYVANTGAISNRRFVYDFANCSDVPADGGPDGMTIDTDGNLWVAVFGAAGVFNINPNTGKLLRKIDIPSLQTTSVAFGGPNLDELYVVSANFALPPDVQKKYPEAGSTFRVTGLGVRGVPMIPAEVSI